MRKLLWQDRAEEPEAAALEAEAEEAAAVLEAAEAAALAVEDTTDRIDLTATITIITTITADFGFLDRAATTDMAAVVVLADF